MGFFITPTLGIEDCAVIESKLSTACRNIAHISVYFSTIDDSQAMFIEAKPNGNGIPRQFFNKERKGWSILKKAGFDIGASIKKNEYFFT